MKPSIKRYRYSAFGETYTVQVVIGRYISDSSRRSVQLFSPKHGPILTASVNTEVQPEENCFFLKDWSENEGVGEWLISRNIAKPTGRITVCGFTYSEEMRFTDEFIASNPHAFPPVEN